MTTAPDITKDTMLAAVADAWEGSHTPDLLREALIAFATDQKRNVESLRCALMITAGCWIVDGVKAGHDRYVLEQIVAFEAQHCVASILRAAKERRGEPFVPARAAIVAFHAAAGIAVAEPFVCDIDGAVDAFEASIADEPSGTPAADGDAVNVDGAKLAEQTAEAVAGDCQ